MKKIQLGINERLVNKILINNEVANPHPYFSVILPKYFDLIAVSVKEEKQLIFDDIPLSGSTKKDKKTQTQQSQNGSPDISNFCGYLINDDLDETSAASSSPTAIQFMRNYPLIPVEDAKRLLGNSQIRDNFFERVFVISRWHEMIKAGVTARQLLKFHAQHKLIIMSHIDYRDLGQLLTKLNKENIQTIAEQYITQLMVSLLGVVNRANHVNVLQHIQGHLKKELSSDHKNELSELVELYRKGVVPLSAVLTLLKHHFRNYPDDYIQEAHYMNPCPYELSLVNVKTTG